MFDEEGNLKRTTSNDEDELVELFESQKIERCEAEINDHLEIDNTDQRSSKNIEEVDKPEEESGPIQNSNQNITHSPKNEDSLDEEENTDLLHQLTSRQRWKHTSTHHSIISFYL